MARYGIGQPVSRKEDNRFTTGHGSYVDDLVVPGQAHAIVVRSPYAHAEVRAVDTAQAANAPGVIAVYTGADIAAAGLGHVPAMPKLYDPDGSRRAEILGSRNIIPPRPALAADRVRYVGDPVAMVVAESRDAARDAADLVVVDYAALPVAIGTATAQRAPAIWETHPENIAFEWQTGDPAAVDQAFSGADETVTVDLVNNRINCNTMEPRAAIGAYDADEDSFTLHVSSQDPHNLQILLGQEVFDLAPEKFRVITPDVGGGFGMKYFLYGEYCLVLWAAKQLGRPVKWACDRSEAFVSDTHGRDHVTRIEAALDKAHRIQAVRVHVTANMGAYYSNVGPIVPTHESVAIQTTVYDVPVIHTLVTAVFTNTSPTDAYRGAGRPETNYMMERLLDGCAAAVGLDRAEIRRINLVPAAAMPYTNACGETYDSGDFVNNVDQACAAAGWSLIDERRAAARAGGSLRGIGIAYYIDNCAGPNLGGEEAWLRFEDNNTASMMVGTLSHGQGHETSFAQVVSERLGVDFDAVNLVQGDTADGPAGSGTGGSRSMLVGGMAVQRSADDAIEKGRAMAADILEVAASDLEYRDGAYWVAGTDRTVDIFDVARAIRTSSGQALIARGEFSPTAASFPNGCHICEVEIDRETGRVEIVAYTVVDDFGRVVNPLLLSGQVHGGIVQGAGQAFIENTVYDPESGQLLTGTFMDYGMPRASDFLMFETHYNEILCTTNPLGVKGAGEAGTIGATPAVTSAIVDALGEFGITHLDMPATPERVWRVVNS